MINDSLQILSKYLKLVDDVERRLTLAKKYGCHDAVVDVGILVGGPS